MVKLISLALSIVLISLATYYLALQNILYSSILAPLASIATVIYLYSLVPKREKVINDLEIYSNDFDEVLNSFKHIEEEDDILNTYSLPHVDETTIREQIVAIQQTFKLHGIQTTFKGYQNNPKTTRYLFVPQPNKNVVKGVERVTAVKVSAIKNLTPDIQNALGTKVIINTFIPNSPNTIGIDVSTNAEVKIGLKNLLNSKEFQSNKGKCLLLPVGVSVDGKDLFVNLNKAPHILVAGATDSGKSVALHSFVCSILLANANCNFVFFDLKRVEFTPYKNMNKLILPVAYDAEQGVKTLEKLLAEMEDRNKFLAQQSFVNISDYNAQAKNKMPYIVAIIDELGSLMLDSTYGKQIENLLIQLLQQSRSSGMHFILATQRPDRKLVDGAIKANCPVRVAFRTSSRADSQVLEMSDTELLTGYGHGLLKTPNSNSLTTFQGCFISPEEIKKVIEHVN